MFVFLLYVCKNYFYMNKLFTLAIAAAISLSVNAQVNMPQPSPTQMIRQDFGMGRIELTYSRPSLRGRKAFQENGELVPLGKPWRTGANAATKIRFTDMVTVGGKNLDSGNYVIYTIPAKGQWDVVFSKGTAYPGAEGFKESDDVVRLKAPVAATDRNVETFTMQFANVKNESCDLQIMWGNAAVNIPITTNIKDRLRAQIESNLKGEKPGYQAAASFYYEWDKDYTKALENVNKGIEGNPKAFWLYLLKARIQKDMGDKSAAKASAAKTIEVAKEAKNDDYVRMANELINKM
jgi:hypothetical protein